MLKKPSSSWLAMNTATLFLIMFIDGLGMSLVLPLIGDLFSTSPNSIISPETPTWVYQLYYAGSLACFSGAMIFGAVVIGQISDAIGRKITLQLALFGTVIGYLVCALAIVIKSPILFLLGRTVDGLTAGSIPVAQAMLSDLDSRKNKMTSIGLVMFAVTSGYMFGPVIAGIAFAGSEGQHLYLPFLLVALLSTACMGLLSLIQVSKSQSSRLRIDLTVAYTQIKALLNERALRLSLFGFFLFQCAWTLFYQYLPQMQLHIQNLTPSKMSLLLSEVGVGMCVTFCFIVPRSQNYLSPKQLILGCVSTFTLLSTAFLMMEINWQQFQFISVMMAVLYAVGYSAMLAYLISISNDNQRGLIFGSVASICAISATFTALLGGTLTGISYSLFFQVLALTSLAALLSFALKRPQPVAAIEA
tara:strand:- start:527 stop:1777 length:1251 start_codon:yes stop_codon:yes gene_type:complete